MNAGRKRLAHDGGVEDILCGLPSDVLYIIFERLPLRDVVRTSILSRKWRYLWSEFPYLVFDKLFFELIFANEPNSANKYVNVINKILFAHRGPVLNFSLFIPDINFDWDEHIDDWLSFLSRNGIKQLSVDNQRNLNLYMLPSYVFSSPELTHLKLKKTFFKEPVSFSGFANLVELSFEDVTFARWEFNDFLPVAPALSKLTFIKCTGIENFKISAPHLLEISVICSNDVTPIFFDNSPNLVRIHIDILETQLVILKSKGHLISLDELNKKFPRVEFLRVNGWYLKLSAATAFKSRLPTVLHHLTTLVLNDLAFDDLGQIMCAFWLVRWSPSLQTFEARPHYRPMSPSGSNFVESLITRLKALDNLGFSLRIVKFESIKGLNNELLFIKYILEHSPNLESFNVNYGIRDSDQRFRISNQLMRFRRASSKAEIIYTG